MSVSDEDRNRFDTLLEEVLEDLPEHFHEMLEQVPLVVLDQPTPDLIAQLVRERTLEPNADPSELCGLHTGIAITDRSIEDPAGWGSAGPQGGPEQINIFRLGIIKLAGGFDGPDTEKRVYEEIRITILHEFGHHFGLDEDDLEALGYD